MLECGRFIIGPGGENVDLERQLLLAAFGLGFAFGFAIAAGIGLYIVIKHSSNLLPSKEEKRLLDCMTACPYPFGTSEFDGWVTECVSKPDGRPVVKSN